MRLETLAVTRDPEALRILRRVIPDLGVTLVVAASAVEARNLVDRRKFDALIIDCDGMVGAAELLQDVRKGASNRSAICFALVRAPFTVQRAFELGANFVLEKPLTFDRATRCFRAAHGLMVREAHRYYRHHVELPVTLDFGGGAVQQVTATNISEGGMAVRSRSKLPMGANLGVTFRLPDTPTTIDARAEVMWSAPDARAGLRLVSISEAAREQLCAWLGRAFDRESNAKTAAVAPMIDLLSANTRPLPLQ